MAVRTISLGSPVQGMYIGFAGTALLAVGSTSTRFSHAGIWPLYVLNIPSALFPEWVLRASLVAGVFAVVIAWWLLRPRAGQSEISSWKVLILWAVPLMFVPPVLTADPFAYADAGWIASQGANPYELGLGGLAGPYAPFVDPLWLGGSVAWPPLTLTVARLGVEVFTFDPYWGVVGQRLVACVGVALMAVLVPRLVQTSSGSTAVATWLALLNPVVVIHFIGGAHVDALAVGIAFLAWWVAQRSPRPLSFIGASLLIGLAMGLKQYTGLAVVAVAALPPLADPAVHLQLKDLISLGWRTALSSGLAIAGFLSVSALTGFGLGWVGRFSQWYNVIGTDYPEGELITPAPSYFFGHVGTVFLRQIGWDTLLAYQLAVVVIALSGMLMLAYLLASHTGDAFRVVGWGGLVVVLSAQQVHPWYIGFGVAALGLSSLNERTVRILMYFVASYVIAYLMVGSPGLAVLMFVACWLLILGGHRTFGVDEKILAASGPTGP